MSRVFSRPTMFDFTSKLGRIWSWLITLVVMSEMNWMWRYSSYLRR